MQTEKAKSSHFDRTRGDKTRYFALSQQPTKVSYLLAAGERQLQLGLEDVIPLVAEL